MMTEKPKRCIDPIIKSCEDCLWGWKSYPDWVETYEDLSYCTIESGCTLGYDQGRPEDEPTEEELKDFERWCNMIYESDLTPVQNDFVDAFEDLFDSHTGAAPEEVHDEDEKR